MSTGLTVSELIAELRKYDRGADLLIDKSPVGLTPTGLDSYRGYYEDLAINVGLARSAPWNVGDLLTALEESVGTTITGYKGGEYVVTTGTRVWISNYGESSGSRVTGTRLADCGCVYITWENDDE